MRIAFASAVVVVGWILFAAPLGRSDEDTDKAEQAARAERAAIQAKLDNLPPVTSSSLRRLLSERIEIPDPFRASPVPLKIVLQYLTDKAASRGESLQITIEKMAFQDLSPDLADQLEASIEFPTFVRSLTNRQALELSVSQLPGDATYLLRDGLVVITSGAAAKIDRLLDRKIAVEFRDKPLVATLEELSELSGVSIAFDPRNDELQKKTVALRFAGDVSVRGILDSLADLHDLKILVSADRVAVLPQSAYLKRLRDRAEESRLLREAETPAAAKIEKCLPR